MLAAPRAVSIQLVQTPNSTYAVSLKRCANGQGHDGHRENALSKHTHLQHLILWHNIFPLDGRCGHHLSASVPFLTAAQPPRKHLDRLAVLHP